MSTKKDDSQTQDSNAPVEAHDDAATEANSNPPKGSTRPNLDSHVSGGGAG